MEWWLKNCQVVCHRATSLLARWENAQELKQAALISQISRQNVIWAKPSPSIYKCNIDASFCKATNKVGIGMCIRYVERAFV